MRFLLILAFAVQCCGLALGGCEPSTNRQVGRNGEASPHVSICDVAKAGPRWNGKMVHLNATLIVDGNGGELHDDHCPKAILGFADDGGAEKSDFYWSFSNSFDRELLSHGVSRQRVEIVGLVEAPGTAGAGKAYGSVILLKRIEKFSPLP
jgi:hypothetical protein